MYRLVFGYNKLNFFDKKTSSKEALFKSLAPEALRARLQSVYTR